MNKRTIACLGLVLGLLIFSAAAVSPWAQEHVPPPYSAAVKAFESYIIEQMALDKVTGLSIGFKKDDFVWAKGFGFADLENLVRAKPESSYRLASVTKTLTAVGVLQLVEAGKINLDAEVQTYVPDFPKKKWPVTVRQLLGHLGGISHYKNYEVEGRIKTPKNTQQALAIFQDFDLVAEPGTRYHYSSYGYNLLGAVIEGVSGKSFGSYLHDCIFEPLGMSNSGMDDPVRLTPNRVRGYRLINGHIQNSEYVDVSSRFAAGGTRSTVVDLLKYAAGIWEGKLLEQDTTRMMFSAMATRKGYLTGYGMGWNVRPWRGYFQVSHSGSQPETRTYLLVFPTEKFAVVMASNREGANLIPYIRRLVELVLEEDMDSAVYVRDQKAQPLYDALAQTFSYGLSQYDWHGGATARGEDLDQAFAYYNAHVRGDVTDKELRTLQSKIDDGIHPVSGEAFIKVGSYMASVLEQAYGKSGLHQYHREGPLAFFRDYLRVSQAQENINPNLRFPKGLSSLITAWADDWERVYTDDLRQLHITIHADLEELEERLKTAFEGSRVYSDFIQDMIVAAQHFLKQENPEQALRMLNLAVDLYPHSPAPLSALAAAHVWTAEYAQAREVYRKAYGMNPAHSSLSIEELEALAAELQDAKKMPQVWALAEIMIELRPKHAGLHVKIGNWHARAGDKEKAREFYERALHLNPKLKEAKEKLEQLKKD